MHWLKFEMYFDCGEQQNISFFTSSGVGLAAVTAGGATDNDLAYGYKARQV